MLQGIWMLPDQGPPFYSGTHFLLCKKGNKKVITSMLSMVLLFLTSLLSQLMKDHARIQRQQYLQAEGACKV